MSDDRCYFELKGSPPDQVCSPTVRYVHMLTWVPLVWCVCVHVRACVCVEDATFTSVSSGQCCVYHVMLIENLAYLYNS